MTKTSPIKPYKLKNGETRYMFKIYIGVDPLTGKERSTTRRSFKKKSEAILAYNRMKFEISYGKYKKQQFKTYQDIYWAEKLTRYKMVKSYASKVIDYAIKLEYIETNPFEKVEFSKKRVKRKSNNYYLREQLINFLNAAKNEGNIKYYTFFQLLGYTGMRKSETLALTWKDIDFNDNTINIDKALGYSKESGLYVKPTKDGETRIIKLDQQTIDILKTWLEKQSEQLQMLGFEIKQSKQLLFSNKDNKHIQPAKTWGWVNNIKVKYNLKHITTHGFRHTHATILTEAGASLVGIKQRLGHSGNDTTIDTYIHVTEKIKNETLEKFVEYMNC